MTRITMPTNDNRPVLIRHLTDPIHTVSLHVVIDKCLRDNPAHLDQEHQERDGVATWQAEKVGCALVAGRPRDAQRRAVACVVTVLDSQGHACREVVLQEVDDG